MRRPDPPRMRRPYGTKHSKPGSTESNNNNKQNTSKTTKNSIHVTKQYKANMKVEFTQLSSHKTTTTTESFKEPNNPEEYDSTTASTPKADPMKLGQKKPVTERKGKLAKCYNPMEATSAPPKIRLTNQKRNALAEENFNMIRKKLFCKPEEDDDHDFYINYHPTSSIGYEDFDSFVIPDWMPMSFRPPPRMNLNDICGYTAAYIFKGADEMVDSHEILVKSTTDVHAERKTLLSLLPRAPVDQEILNLVVAGANWLIDTLERNKCIFYFPTQFTQYAIHQPNSVDKVRTTYQKHFLPPKSSPAKIFVPMNDKDTHWYLVVFDFQERKIFWLDSLPSAERHNARRLDILKVAIFLESILLHPSYGEISANVPRYLPTNFCFVQPRWLPEQRTNSNDCGVWVAKWIIEGGHRSDYENITVVTATRMKLALYLALSDNNVLKGQVVSNATKHWEIQLKKRKALVKV